LIVASAYDAAVIAQKARIAGLRVPLYCAGWAMTSMLIENGGKAVEGAQFVSGFDQRSQRPEFLEFKKRYRERFDADPDVMATTSYEATHVLAAALEKTGGGIEGLREALPGTSIRGTHAPVSIDACGDGVRPLYLVAVKDGLFVTEGTVSQ
jgi:branched-chain amino acid transport system substrate-binding protein